MYVKIIFPKIRYFSYVIENSGMKRFIPIILLLCFCLTAIAQDKVMLRPYIDQRKWHWGFSVGINTQYLAINNNGNIYAPASGAASEEWYAQTESYAPGFTVGVLGAMRITDYLEFRIIPTLYFGEATIGFKEQISGAKASQILKSTYIALPLDLKIAGPRWNNMRAYGMVGVSPLVNLTVKKDKELLVNRFDCMFEIGFGTEFYFSFFKLIPELKFCFGLTDMINRKRTDLKNPDMLKYTQCVESAYNKMVALTLYFE